jgi:hypothetical protein
MSATYAPIMLTTNRDVSSIPVARDAKRHCCFTRERQLARTSRGWGPLQLGENNLVGSAGEFRLLFAFLAHCHDTKEIDGEPALFVGNVETMFVHKLLPKGWETWKKSRADWVVHTIWLLLSADTEYRRLTGE